MLVINRFFVIFTAHWVTCWKRKDFFVISCVIWAYFYAMFALLPILSIQKYAFLRFIYEFHNVPIFRKRLISEGSSIGINAYSELSKDTILVEMGFFSYFIYTHSFDKSYGSVSREQRLFEVCVPFSSVCFQWQVCIPTMPCSKSNKLQYY